MKQTLMVLVALTALALVGCSKKSSNNPVAPNPAPQQTNVAFTMHLESGTQGMIFVAKPNVDVKLTKVDISFPAQNFADTLTNPDPNEVFPKNSSIHLNEYTGIDAGQQWVLKFYGTVAATGKSKTTPQFATRLRANILPRPHCETVKNSLSEILVSSGITLKSSTISSAITIHCSHGFVRLPVRWAFPGFSKER